MVSSSLILALVRLTNAANLTRFNIMRGPKVNSVGIGYNLVETDGCGIGEKSCDSNYCIPLTGSCCSIGDGSYCKVGKYCVTGGCCQIGKVCSDGGSGSCDTGEKACGKFCIPSSGECCQESTGRWCESGTTCAAGGTKCNVGSFTSTTVSGSSTTSYITSRGAAGTSTSESRGSVTTTTSNPGPSATDPIGRDDHANSAIPVGAIVGGTLTGVGALAIGSLGLVLILRHRSKKKDNEPFGNQSTPTPMGQSSPTLLLHSSHPNPVVAHLPSPPPYHDRPSGARGSIISSRHNASPADFPSCMHGFRTAEGSTSPGEESQSVNSPRSCTELPSGQKCGGQHGDGIHEAPA